MKTAKRIAVSAVFCTMICLIPLLGCSSPISKFVGKWYDSKHSVLLDVRKDHTCRKSIPGLSGQAKWEPVDDTTIKVTFVNMGRVEAENATIKGGTLVFESLVMKKLE